MSAGALSNFSVPISRECGTMTTSVTELASLKGEDPWVDTKTRSPISGHSLHLTGRPTRWTISATGCFFGVEWMNLIPEWIATNLRCPIVALIDDHHAHLNVENGGSYEGVGYPGKTLIATPPRVQGRTTTCPGKASGVFLNGENDTARIFTLYLIEKYAPSLQNP